MNLNKTILLIEDYEASRLLYEDLLKTKRFSVVGTDNAHSALEFLKENATPALVIMDLVLPQMGPEEFVQKLRAQESWSRIPLFVVSGHYDIEDHAQKLGANAYLKKPFDIYQFLNIVQTLTLN